MEIITNQTLISEIFSDPYSFFLLFPYLPEDAQEVFAERIEIDGVFTIEKVKKNIARFNFDINPITGTPDTGALYVDIGSGFIMFTIYQTAYVSLEKRFRYALDLMKLKSDNNNIESHTSKNTENLEEDFVIKTDEIFMMCSQRTESDEFVSTYLFKQVEIPNRMGQYGGG